MAKSIPAAIRSAARPLALPRSASVRGAVAQAAETAGPKKRSWLAGSVRREEILKSAIQVFASKSYQGTTVRDIAGEAGVSEALLYKYFPSKKALFLEAFERSNRFLFMKFQEVLKSSRRPTDIAKGLFLTYIGFLQEDRVYPRMLFLAMAELDDPEFRRVVVGGLKRTARLIQKSLRQAQSVGMLRKDLNVEALAWVMLGAYQILALMKEAGILGQIDSMGVARIVDPMLALWTRNAGNPE